MGTRHAVAARSWPSESHERLHVARCRSLRHSRIVELRLPAHRSPLLVALLLGAFLARGLIPTGFMPATHAGPGVQLTLCTAHGLAPSATAPGLHYADDAAPAGDADPEPRTPAPHDGSSEHESPCAYAVAATVVPPSALVSATLPPTVGPRLVEHFVTTGTRPSIVRAQSPRAPPAHA